MLVIICGMHRSGSTLVAQLVRGLLESQDLPLTISDNGLGSTDEELHARAADPNHIWLVKVHQQARRFRDRLPDKGAVYFYTYRDMRDALASAWRKNRLHLGHPERSPESLQAFVRAQLKAAKVFEARKNLWRGRYEDFVCNLNELTYELAAVLNVQTSTDLVAKLVSAASPEEQRKRVLKLSKGDQAVRADSFITSNHITDGREGAWKETLTFAEAEMTESIAEHWLKAKGYQLYFNQSGNTQESNPEKNRKGSKWKSGFHWHTWIGWLKPLFGQ